MLHGWYNSNMHERLEKYYDGRTCGDYIDESSAISALAALIDGRTHGGALFKMHSDEFMKEHLYPEDYEFWMEQKRIQAD